MNKLLKLKEWLSIADAARQLSCSLQEEVKEADVLQLAMDRKLTVSVRLTGCALARPGKLVPVAQARLVEIPWEMNDKPVRVLAGIAVSDEEVLELDQDVIRLDGIVDLPMVGGEQNDVERAYRAQAQEPMVDLVSVDGTFVVAPSGQWFQLQERFTGADRSGKPLARDPWNHPDNFYPAGGLPEESMLVVRPSAIADFLQRAETPIDEIERPLGARERGTLLTIIAVLAKEAKFDLKNPSKAASILAAETERLGCAVSRRAIEDHLKRVPAALEKRARA